MGQYIPDLTERFPEGLDGVDMTDRYFPPSHYNSMYDWDLMERMDALEREYNDMPELEQEPRQFKLGGEYTKVGFYGGVTTYIVKKIDRENKKILLGEVWHDLDGSGVRKAKWHKLATDDDGNEKALEWVSEQFGEVWIEA